MLQWLPAGNGQGIFIILRQRDVKKGIERIDGVVRHPAVLNFPTFSTGFAELIDLFKLIGVGGNPIFVRRSIPRFVVIVGIPCRFGISHFSGGRSAPIGVGGKPENNLFPPREFFAICERLSHVPVVRLAIVVHQKRVASAVIPVFDGVFRIVRSITSSALAVVF
ncbi:MAG: hypothetical protein ACLFQQ_03620 [Desulfococcaceae bacterium]